MSFKDFFSAIMKRNRWTEETVVQCKVSAVEKLAQQSYDHGYEQALVNAAKIRAGVDAPSPNVDFGDLFKGMKK